MRQWLVLTLLSLGACSSPMAYFFADGPTMTAMGLKSQAEGDLDSALVSFGKACEAGERRACFELGLKEFEASKPGQALGHFEKACDLGHPRSCLRYTRMAPVLLSQPRWPGTMVQDRFCSLGFPDACMELGFWHLRKRNLKRAQASFEKGCGLGSAESCLWIPWKNPVLKRNCHTGHARSCLALGLSKKAYLKPACQFGSELGCHLLKQKKPVVTQRSTHRTQCRQGNSTSCWVLTYLELPRRRLDAANTACKQKVSGACLMLARSRLFRGQHRDGWELLQRACKQGSGEACALWADHLQALRKPREARGFYQRACEVSPGLGCARLGSFLKPRNEAAATQALTKSCKANFWESCIELAETHGKSGLLSNSCQWGYSKSCAAKLLLEDPGLGEEDTREKLRWLCKEGQPKACMALSVVSTPSSDLEEALSRACKQGHAQSCALAQKNRSGCDLGWAPSCERLSDEPSESDNEA